MIPVPLLWMNQQGTFSPFFTSFLKSLCQPLWTQMVIFQEQLVPEIHMTSGLIQHTWSRSVAAFWRTWWHLVSLGPHLDAGPTPRIQYRDRIDLEEDGPYRITQLCRRSKIIYFQMCSFYLVIHELRGTASGCPGCRSLSNPCDTGASPTLCVAEWQTSQSLLGSPSSYDP